MLICTKLKSRLGLFLMNSKNCLGLNGKGIEISFPKGFLTKIDVRYKNPESETNPLRFRIKPASGEITYQGVVIGNYQKARLCSGDFRKICKIVRTKDKFLVIFKS